MLFSESSLVGRAFNDVQIEREARQAGEEPLLQFCVSFWDTNMAAEWHDGESGQQKDRATPQAYEKEAISPTTPKGSNTQKGLARPQIGRNTRKEK